MKLRITVGAIACAMFALTGCSGAADGPTTSAPDRGSEPFTPGTEQAPSAPSQAQGNDPSGPAKAADPAPSSDPAPSGAPTGAPSGDPAPTTAPSGDSDAGAAPSDSGAAPSDSGAATDTGASKTGSAPASGSDAGTGSKPASDAGSTDSAPAPSTPPATAPSTAPTTAPTTAPSTAPTTAPSTPPTTAPSTPPTTAPSTPPTTAPTTTHTADIVAEIARELANKTSSVYTHTTSIDEAKGIYDYDCSGFVGYAISRAYPAGFTAIQTATESRPLASDFESFFAAIKSSTQWTSVAKAIDLRPGDIVAWLEPAVLASGNTGHVMFVYGTPKAGTRPGEIIVPIVDSTSTPHGPTDQRMIDGTTGLGQGQIGLVVDASGAPTGYYWTGGYSSTSYDTSIALGRAL